MKKETKKKKESAINPGITIVLAVAFFLIVVPSIVDFSRNLREQNYSTDNLNKGNIEILTDKNVYTTGEKINLTVKNNNKHSIYFEPCEYLNDFEKKTNGEWKKESVVVGDNYNKSVFNKNKSSAECEVSLPESGSGVYRIATLIYYDCQKPGYDSCARSEISYSNEFEVR